MNYDRHLIVLGLLGIVVFACLFVPPFIAAMLIPAAVIGVILLGHPRILLFTYLWVMGVIALLQLAVPLAQIKYLDEVFGITLFGIFFGHIAVRKMAFSDGKRFGKIASMMFGFIILSWLINRGGLRPALQTMASYFSFIPAYIIAIKHLKKSDYKLLIIGTIIFFWINFILNIAWQLGINPLPNFAIALWKQSGGHSSGFVDYATGTLGGCNYVAYFCVMFFFLLASMLRSPLPLGKTLRLWMKITLPCVLIQLYLTFTNHAYMLFALVLIPYFLISGLWKKWWAIGGATVVIFAIPFIITSSEDLQKNFSEENLTYRYEKLSDSAKVQLYDQLLIGNLSREPMHWLLGVGPGEGIGPIGKDNLTPFALKMLLPFYQSTGQKMRSMQMSSISGNTTSGIFTIWGDFGLVGFLIFISFYLWLVTICLRYSLKRDRTESTVIAEFLVPALLFFLMINILIDIVAIEAIVIWIWIWAAILKLSKDAELIDEQKAEMEETTPQLG